MPTLTFSPSILEGGTLNLLNSDSHICALSDTRFFMLFSQRTPNYTFAVVSDVSNIRSSSPTITNTKQTLLEPAILQRCRTWKLSNSRVLALMGNNLRVLEVDSAGNTTFKNAQIASFHTYTLWGTQAHATLGTGENLYGVHIKENTVWFIQRISTTSAIYFFKVVYNPSTDTLVQTGIAKIADSTTSTHVWRQSIQKIAGTSLYLVYGVGLATSASAGTVQAARIYNDEGSLVSTLPTPPTGTKRLVGLGSTRILGLNGTITGQTWRMYDGTSWSVDDAIFSLIAHGSVLTDAEALDQSYFMLVSAKTTEPGAGSFRFRISRFISSTLGQSSPATNTQLGIEHTVTNCYFDQPRLIRQDANTFFMFGRGSSTSFLVHTLYT